MAEPVDLFSPREFWLLAPEGILALAGLVLLVVSASRRGFPHRDAAGIALLGVGVAAGLVVAVHARVSEPRLILGGGFALDPYGRAWKLVILLGVAMVVLLSARAVEQAAVRAGEYYALLLLAACGMLVMAGGYNLLTLWLGLELLALPSYILAGYFREQRGAAEAALKYFVLGILSSAILLYGISLLYGVTGTLRLDQLATALPGAGADGSLAVFGWLLLLAGLFFKIAAAPFHVWTPDVYEGAPTPITAFLAVASKAASFALLVRVVLVGLPSERPGWQLVVAAVAVLSMVWGNLAALTQQSVKRLLAYSAIAHSGYALVGLLAASPRGLTAVLFYVFAYALFTAGAFAVVIVLERGRYVRQSCSDYAGLASRGPGLAAAMLVFLVALTGIPPTGGFVGKFLLFAAAVEAGWTAVAVVGVVTSAISLYTYFRIVVYMYQQPPMQIETPISEASGVGAPPAGPVPVGLALGSVIVLALAATLFLGILPGPALDWASAALPLAARP